MSAKGKSAGRVLMAAAECKGIAKVGGLGDVVCDLSHALQEAGQLVTVVMPGYESVPLTDEHATDLKVRFAGRDWKTGVQHAGVGSVDVLLLRQPTFFGGPYSSVYVDSSALGRGPFEDDARRFAFFSAAVAQLLLHPDFAGDGTVVHCHDWHTGTIPMLARMTRRFAALSGLRFRSVMPDALNV